MLNVESGEYHKWRRFAIMDYNTALLIFEEGSDYERLTQFVELFLTFYRFNYIILVVRF